MSLSEKFGIPASLLDAAKKTLAESDAYQQKVKAHMAKKGVKSLNDMTPDQKKKFFNELDAMHTAKHEEVEAVEEGTGVTDYAPKSQGGTRKELLAKYHKSKNPKDAEAARKAGATQKELQGEEFESVEEELKGDMHPGAKKVLKHIKPEHHDKYKPYLKKGVYKGDYKDRAAVLSAAERAKHTNEEFDAEEDFDLDDFSLEDIEAFMQTEEYEQLDELSKETLKSYKKKATDNLQSNVHRKHGLETVRTLMGRLAEPDKNKKPSKGGYKTITQVAREQDNANVSDGLKRHMPHMADKVNQMHKELQADRVKTTRNINNRKAGLDSAEKRLRSRKYGKNEDFDILSDFSLEDIESFMQTEDYNQLDELSKNTLASYIKKRSHDVAAMGAVTRKHAMDSEAARKDQNYSQARKSDDKANKAFMKGWKHRQNIGKAVDKLTKEELEFIESLNAGTAKE